MILGSIIAIIIFTILFAIIIKDSWQYQQRGEITIYRNIYDMFFNAIVYILPAIVFFIDKPWFNNTLCYVLLCIGFSVFMCVSAWDSNYTLGSKILASIIKIITGIETILVIIVVLLLLLLIFGGKGDSRNEEYD